MDTIYQISLKDNFLRKTIYLYTRDHEVFYQSYEDCVNQEKPFEAFNREAYERAYNRYLAQNN
jgi:hypothetical protein